MYDQFNLSEESYTRFYNIRMPEYRLQDEEQRLAEIELWGNRSCTHARDLDVRTWESEVIYGRCEAVALIEQCCDDLRIAEFNFNAGRMSLINWETYQIENITRIAFYQTFLDVEYSLDA